MPEIINAPAGSARLFFSNNIFPPPQEAKIVLGEEYALKKFRKELSCDGDTAVANKYKADKQPPPCDVNDIKITKDILTKLELRTDFLPDDEESFPSTVGAYISAAKAAGYIAEIHHKPVPKSDPAARKTIKPAIEQRDGYFIIRNADWDLAEDKDGKRRPEDAEIRVADVQSWRRNPTSKVIEYEATIEVKYKSSAIGKRVKQTFYLNWDSSAKRTWTGFDLRLDLPWNGYDGIADHIGLPFLITKKEAENLQTEGSEDSETDEMPSTKTIEASPTYTFKAQPIYMMPSWQATYYENGEEKIVSPDGKVNSIIGEKGQDDGWYSMFDPVDPDQRPLLYLDLKQQKQK
jgi:hypothetical protein